MYFEVYRKKLPIMRSIGARGVTPYLNSGVLRIAWKEGILSYSRTMMMLYIYS